MSLTEMKPISAYTAPPPATLAGILELAAKLPSGLSDARAAEKVLKYQNPATWIYADTAQIKKPLNRGAFLFEDNRQPFPIHHPHRRHRRLKWSADDLARLRILDADALKAD